MNSEWVKVYDQFAGKYADAASQAGYMIDGKAVDDAYFDRWFILMQSHLELREGQSLVDVGCGSGLFLRRFSEITPRVFGVDPSPELVRVATAAVPAATVRVGNVFDAGFEREAFDVVFCNNVMYMLDSLEDAKRAIEHFLAITAPTGRIWLGDLPRPTSEMSQGGNYRRQTKAVALESQHYPPELLEEWCRTLGVRGGVVEQEIEGKTNSAFRYDYLIDKS